ncbi:MAG: bifunctional glutamate N-acetyltransferase/amino-acid acetyltransferase ArgJ [Verrucomicrobiota bacterium]|nr:bifunctional glutamate N-acetyltransferase/amino-acid acetyltransferase ArgJ [Verrucomicrobiota bacterium]
MNLWKHARGGVTAPAGYRACGVAAGVKPGRNDMALLVSDADATVAGVFTTNRIQGAHVKLCRERLKDRRARAVVVNAGNANACNGPQGVRDARRMAALTAGALGVAERTVFVCSTGVIGRPMPMDKIAKGIRLAAQSLSRAGGAAAARAILTTDTTDKQVALEFSIDGRRARIGGMAKGAGMIEPSLATMLAFLTTDAAVAAGALQAALAAAVEHSFNRITVDGDQSCNDTALFLANGAAGNRPLTRTHRQWPVFVRAVEAAALALALKVAEDGEGATKFVTVNVRGAASAADAHAAARAIANSLLVKTSWFGEDPNWGRIIDAVGYSGARVAEEKVDIRFDELLVVRRGRMASAKSPAELRKALGKKRFSVNVDLRLGRAADTVYTCDCSPDYARINSEYTT